MISENKNVKKINSANYNSFTSHARKVVHRYPKGAGGGGASKKSNLPALLWRGWGVVKINPVGAGRVGLSGLVALPDYYLCFKHKLG